MIVDTFVVVQMHMFRIVLHIVVSICYDHVNFLFLVDSSGIEFRFAKLRVFVSEIWDRFSEDVAH